MARPRLRRVYGFEFALALTLLVAAGCSSTPPTPTGVIQPPTAWPPTASATPVPTVVAPTIACAEIGEGSQLCKDMAAAAIEAVGEKGLPVGDVWLSSGMLCFVVIDCLFDPNANFPLDLPPEGGQWVGSAEVAFQGTDEHAGVSLARVGDSIVPKLLGYRVPPMKWCSGGCPGSHASDGPFRFELVMPRTVWHVADPISGTTVLSYVGDEPITVGASGQGVVFFEFDSADGVTHISYPMTADCVPYVIEPATPLNQDLRMTADGPPDAHLAAGDWTITATAAFGEGQSCSGASHNIKTSLHITVKE